MDRISAQQSKLIKRLTLKKYRKIEQMFLVEGVKLCQELIQQSRFSVYHIFCTELHRGFVQSIEGDIPYSICDAKDIAKHSQLSTSPGIIAVVKMPKETRSEKPTYGWSLVLDGVSDPGNLGTLIRIADWFGFEQVLCTDDCVDSYSTKVVQASMGSIFRKTPQYLSRGQIGLLLDEVPVFIADMSGVELGQVDWPKRGALIMGSESHGPSQDLISLGKAVTIPRFGEAESLNVAIAASVISSQIFL